MVARKRKTKAKTKTHQQQANQRAVCFHFIIILFLGDNINFLWLFSFRSAEKKKSLAASNCKPLLSCHHLWNRWTDFLYDLVSLVTKYCHFVIKRKELWLLSTHSRWKPNDPIYFYFYFFLVSWNCSHFFFFPTRVLWSWKEIWREKKNEFRKTGKREEKIDEMKNCMRHLEMLVEMWIFSHGRQCLWILLCYTAFRCLSDQSVVSIVERTTISDHHLNHSHMFVSQALQCLTSWQLELCTQCVSIKIHIHTHSVVHRFFQC